MGEAASPGEMIAQSPESFDPLARNLRAFA